MNHSPLLQMVELSFLKMYRLSLFVTGINLFSIPCIANIFPTYHLYFGFAIFSLIKK